MRQYRFFLKFIVLILASAFVLSGCGWEEDTSTNITGKGVASISFVSATPSTIVTKGYGTTKLPESSTLVFKVLDENKGAVEGANISFTLPESVVSLGVTLSLTNVKSDKDGFVEVTASSGSEVTSFFITALYSANNIEISTKSESVTVIKKSDLVKSISFMSASSTTIAVKGNGNSLVPDYTDVRFLLTDESGSPVTGAMVNWYLPNNGGGIALSSQTGVSDSNGEVAVRAFAGSSITAFEIWIYPETSTSIKQKSPTLTITSNKVKAFSFISGEPTLIALKGTGGVDITETSKLTFKAVDETGVPVVGSEIKFDLSTKHGGIKFATDPDKITGMVTGKTNPDGLVSINVISGTIPTSVNVTATVLNDPTIWSISNPINVSTGRPTQETFSCGAVGSSHAVGGWDTNGIEKTIAARAYDRFHHPVPDGTVIHFRTEYGGIQPYCTTQDGSCSVKWWSSGDRTFLMRQINKGVVTINASVMGEEAFVDIDGDGLYTSNDYLTQPWEVAVYDKGELFVDNVQSIRAVRTHEELKTLVPSLADTVDPIKLPDNNGLKWKWVPETANYQINTDEFLDDNLNGICDPGNGIYNGVLCSDEEMALGHCSKDLIRVWVQSEIILTPTNPVASAKIKIYDAVTALEVTGISIGHQYVLEIVDSNNNPLPMGTKYTIVSLDAEDKETKPSAIRLDNGTLANNTQPGYGSTLFNFGILDVASVASIKITVTGEGGENILKMDRL